MKRKRITNVNYRRFGFKAPHELNTRVGYRGGVRL